MSSALQESIDPATVIVTAAILIGLSGVPGLILRKPGVGQAIASCCTVAASCAGLIAAIVLLLSGKTESYVLAWALPFGPCELSVDPLSAFFLLPVFLVASCAALYAPGYWPATEHRTTEPGLTFFTGVLVSSMALLVLARNGLLFIMIWEIMALSAYFLLVTEHDEEEVRTAGTVYLLATHTGTAALLVLFSLLAAATGSFAFPVTGALSPLIPSASALVLLSFVGFGAKAGLMPFHIWLPAAHANAPSHVSALMSGVMLKMGIYGILRVLSFFQTQPLWWGALLTGVGICSALLGVTFAMAQRDVKRLLACSSIENIGIIATGLGLGLMGQATGNIALAFLGLAGGLFHLLNHSMFKPLLFLGSGAIIHGAGTRLMDLMGGLGKRMPRTALLFLVGSLAICGLPPLNGFASEFIIYLALFRQLAAPSLSFLVLLVPILALVGGLAVIAFVKLYGSVFLGTPRSDGAAHGHEPGRLMRVPMALLAGIVVLAGLFPLLVLRMVEPVIVATFPGLQGKGISVATLMPHLSWLTLCGAGLLALGAVMFLVYRSRLAHSPGTITTTWGCGYLKPTPRMQYTATSFSEMAVGIFGGLVRQKIDRPSDDAIFPRPCRVADRPTETILERMIVPIFTVAGSSFSYLRRLQHGELQLYMLYIFATLFVLMICGHW